ncbi:hypothetical protein BKA67DRAFT_254501 [Truncatella angustata]|uniref:Solute-binding protein family 5 domain-containing protein n=1 Tax=Truncatella angustata TaxID=152316 RepID=A0A9P8UPM6_9PEZI|nr:uncharacterized protein BKA67DRAFT_254501 [Truncatella angustata]KAH6656043.1 hypothetical protein BKA67DRAFT_254501 [Truncatella angustata]KAH8198392.1 hypothetical protein TruAng_007427 [Truncatella angustata]
MTPESVQIVLENVDFRLPTQVTDDNSVVALKSLVFEPLLWWQPHGRVKPGLFASWEHSPNGLTWRFHIRDDAHFHDGLPCTAQEVVTYILGFLNSHDYFGMPWSYSRYFARTTVRAESDRTVRFENPEPFADILDILCDFWPSRIAVDGKPVLGTGPYRVADFERNGGVGKATLHLLRPNQENEPHIITVTQESNAAKRLQLLRDGEVDAALNLERVENLDLLTFDSSLRWGRVGSTLSVMYYLNCPRGVFHSPEVRLAANLALDNDALVKEVYEGLATPSVTIVSPQHHGFVAAALQPIPYDPVRARGLLEGLKLEVKPALKLRTPTYMPEHAQRISKFVKSALETVGFDVEVEVETNRPEYARQIGLRKQIGDLALFDSTPNSTFRVLDDKISSNSRNTWWMGYHDDELQRLFEDARHKIKAEERAEAYGSCLRRLQENPPWLYVAHPDVVWATRPGLTLSIGHSGILKLK